MLLKIKVMSTLDLEGPSGDKHGNKSEPSPEIAKKFKTTLEELSEKVYEDFYNDKIENAHENLIKAEDILEVL